MSADLARNLCLLVPLLATVALIRGLRPQSTRLTTAGFGFAWAAAALVVAHQLNLPWNYAPSPATLLGVPVEALCGWALLWGTIPVLVGGPWFLWLGAALWVDLLAMPHLAPFVTLHDGWLAADAALIVAIVVPAALFGEATSRQQALWFRVVVQAATAGTLLGFVVPSLALRVSGTSWVEFADAPLALRVVGIAALSLAALPVVAAVWELWSVGRGTPFPADPPARLVTTGPFAFVANPMQLGVVLYYLALSVVFGSVYLVVAAAVAAAFSATFAEHSERQALTARWPEHQEYRRHVRAWLPRWRPYVAEECVVFVDDACGSCQDLAAAIRALKPARLTVRPASTATTPLRRLTWVDSRGSTDDGVAAFARCLEHGPLPCAVVGWAVRLPGVRHVVGAAADAVGFGPRSSPTCPTHKVA